MDAGATLVAVALTDAPDNRVSPGVDAFFTTLPAGHIIDSIISRGRAAASRNLARKHGGAFPL